LRPRLMWTMAFATFFITIANTSGNAIAFARFVMIAALPTETKLEALDSKVVKLVAINIVSVVCLLHYFSHNLGRFLNKLLAIYKFCLLIAVMIAGFCASRVKNGEFDRNVAQNTKNQLGGLVLVLYSFTGWENANYVC
jgi:amino acid transporter